ncbi:putative salicylate hydroxylase [Aspergillus sclerotioniger CBS 115572]|uniref:Putative salicylate hydroxylase n=1 Tax=Aspergillus sclerotioniger CBS 115572 TaxID=1450535 RepID=A0A317XEE0_9EURO|nr:putative salicylate hydroxylase [Aspergillus sclerotioniger CBS 115572]PWY96142.1 putative salicylate hydroxylase [Aspergillus sclerotioniger CBS 115572]
MGPPRPFTVTIIGGGIGGLVLAVGLLRRHVPVQIYEAAEALTEIGLGLSIGPAAHRAMPLIDPQIRDIYDSLVTTHAVSPGYEQYKQTWFEIVWAGGDHESETLMDLKALPSGKTTLRCADYLAALVALIPPKIVHFGKRLRRLMETSDKVRLWFEDGTTATADVVESMLPDESRVKQPQYSGMYGCRAVFDMEDMVEAVGDQHARVSTMYIGKGAYAISYPIMRAKKVKVGLYILSERWDYEAWVRPANARGMGGYVNSLVERMPDPSQWAIFDHPHLSTYFKSRVAIMGDAAHASTSHQGAGAGQAIEDAHVLAELLSDSRVTSVDDVVGAQHVVTTSKENAYLLCFCFEGTFQQRLRWLWDLDVQEQVEKARRR